MGFSVGGNGQWNESFNWKPSDSSVQVGGFKDNPLIKDFVAAYGKATEPNLQDYSTNKDYITNMRWKAPYTDGAVQLGDMGGVFSAAKNPDAIYNVFGGKGIDNITGGNKADFIQGQGGNDIVYGKGGNDELWGGGGADKLYGGEGRDALYGNDGDDTLFGDAGNDLLLGDVGNDTLDGGDGDDYVFGGKGNDIMSGGKGADRFYLSELSGAGTKIKDFKGADGDNIWIIDDKGKKADYQFVQVGNDVQIKNKNGTVMATVENANADDVKEKTQIGASRFEDYADTSLDNEPYGKVSKNPPSRIELDGLDSIKDVKNTDKTTKTFELKDGVTTEIDGFAYGSGQRLKLGAGVDPKDVTATISRDFVTIKDGPRELATLTPPTGTTDLSTWMKNVQKALKEIGVNAKLP